MNKPNLGKLLPVGYEFFTETKRMGKNRHGQSKLNKELNGTLITYEVLRTGDKRFFIKGKRRYYCEVLGLAELRTGLHRGSIQTPANLYPPARISGLRWWQFTYMVKILEN